MSAYIKRKKFTTTQRRAIGRKINQKAGGLTSHPDFNESLRLLVEEERYCLEDIGAMFDRTRERVRQWCTQRGLVHRDPGLARGMGSMRIWDDQRNRFRPVSRKLVRRTLHARVMQAKKQDAVTRREAKRDKIVATVRALQAALGRVPSSWEMLQAVDPVRAAEHGQAQSLALLVSAWGSPPKNTKARLKHFRAVTGVPAREVGGRGHLTPFKARPARSACMHGHAMTPENTRIRDATRSDGTHYQQRLCRVCERARDKRSHARKKQRAKNVSRKTL